MPALPAADAPSSSSSSQTPDRLPDRVWVPALLAGLLALGFVGVLLVRAGGDPSLLVHAAGPCTTTSARPPSPNCDGDLPGHRALGGATGAPGSLTVQAADQAFDGQFFYRLGVAPWSTGGRVAGVQFDLPSLRNARWGYGALAYVASAGDPDLVPWTLVGLNLAAATAAGAIGGGLARSSGRHAAWGLLLVLWPGFAYSLSLDTSELVASAFLLGGLLAIRHRRWAVAAIALTAAVLTRDTTAVVPFGIAVAGTWTWWRLAHRPFDARPSHPARDAGHPLDPSAEDRADGRTDTMAATPSEGPAAGEAAAEKRAADPVGRQEGAAVLAVCALALVAFAGWQLVQRARFGALPLTSSGDNNLTAPLSGLARELGHDLPPGSGEEAFRLLCILGLAALVATAGYCWRRTSVPATERVAWLFAVAVAGLLNAYLWSGTTAFARATTEAGLLSILVILGSSRSTRDRERLMPLVALGLGGFWLLTAGVQVAKLG
ncbi:MAG: hypothetical protein ACR2MB_10135 [Acidimicrobiales bacterium]